jgi:hypothetical protein
MTVEVARKRIRDEYLREDKGTTLTVTEPCLRSPPRSFISFLQNDTPNS